MMNQNYFKLVSLFLVLFLHDLGLNVDAAGIRATGCWAIKTWWPVTCEAKTPGSFWGTCHQTESDCCDAYLVNVADRAQCSKSTIDLSTCFKVCRCTCTCVCVCVCV